MHGKKSEITVDTGCRLFAGLPEKIRAGRYHSLAAKDTGFPEKLQITGKTGDQEVMAVKHKKYEIYGLQFHPESILTPMGKQILTNFLSIE